MFLLIHHFAILNFERIQVNALIKGENGVTNGGVVSQTQIFLRRARWRSWVTMPVGENLQTLTPSISQCRKLVLWRKREMLWRVVDIFHPIVLCHHIAFWAAGAQQVATRLVGAWLINLSMISCGIFIFSFLTLNS